MLNLTGTADARIFSGMSGVAGQALLSPAALLSALSAWVLLPLAAATALFARRPV
jgi:Cu-processing system permease protein